jgi:hypothetical protein
MLLCVARFGIIADLWFAIRRIDCCALCVMASPSSLHSARAVAASKLWPCRGLALAVHCFGRTQGPNAVAKSGGQNHAATASRFAARRPVNR